MKYRVHYLFNLISLFFGERLLLYVAAVRPWSLVVSLTPIILGTLLAFKLQHVFDLPVLICTTLTVICVHSAGNLVNTYYDFKRMIYFPIIS